MKIHSMSRFVAWYSNFHLLLNSVCSYGGDFFHIYLPQSLLGSRYNLLAIVSLWILIFITLVNLSDIYIYIYIISTFEYSKASKIFWKFINLIKGNHDKTWFWFQLIRTELELDLDFIISRTRPGTVISELKLKYMPLKKWLESRLTSS